MSKCDEFAKLMVDAGRTVENRSYLELACALEDKCKEIERLKAHIIQLKIKLDNNHRSDLDG